jgi:NAD-dependent SIR2 family protein deacetylase
MITEPDARVMLPRKVSTVVLTGAGFSKDAGLPLTSEIVQRGRNLLNIRYGPNFVSALDDVAHEVLGEKVGDEIEAVLTRMKVLELYSEKYNPDEPGSDGERNYLAKLLPLEMCIYYLVWETLKQPSNVPPLYDDFLKSFGDDVAFATLNYDLLLETIFGRNQCAWYYPLQGEMKLFHNELRPYDGSFYAPPNQDSLSIPYLKLHGSFNWYYCWRCKCFDIVQDPDIGLNCDLLCEGRPPMSVGSMKICNSEACGERWTAPGVGQAVLKPLIIPPARMKEYSQAPVLRHWAFFELLLRQARELILIGTSIRDEDVLLVNSLNLLRHKNPQLERIVVIDPMPEIVSKVKSLSEVETTWYSSLEAYNSGATNARQ